MPNERPEKENAGSEIPEEAGNMSAEKHLYSQANDQKYGNDMENSLKKGSPFFLGGETIWKTNAILIGSGLEKQPSSSA